MTLCVDDMSDAQQLLQPFIETCCWVFFACVYTLHECLLACLLTWHNRLINLIIKNINFHRFSLQLMFLWLSLYFYHQYLFNFKTCAYFYLRSSFSFCDRYCRNPYLCKPRDSKVSKFFEMRKNFAKFMSKYNLYQDSNAWHKVSQHFLIKKSSCVWNNKHTVV